MAASVCSFWAGSPVLFFKLALCESELARANDFLFNFLMSPAKSSRAGI